MDDHEAPQLRSVPGEWDSAAHEPVESFDDRAGSDSPQVPQPRHESDTPEQQPAQPETGDWPFSEPLPAGDADADDAVTVADEESGLGQPERRSGPT